MSVFFQTEIVDQEYLEGGKPIVIQEEVEQCYLETKVDGKMTAIPVPEDDVYDIHQKADDHILEDDVLKMIDDLFKQEDRDTILTMLNDDDVIDSFLSQTRAQILEKTEPIRTTVIELRLRQLLMSGKK